MFRLLAIATVYTLLSACASGGPAREGRPQTEQNSAAQPESTAGAVAQAAAKPPERPIPDDSIYPLLVAEFALRRRAYDVALDNYLVQSRILRDAGVSAHTTHLTQFMQREPEALQSVQLWVELDPDNVEANNTLAALLVRRGRSLEALPHMAVVQRHGVAANFPALLNGFAELNDQQQADLVRGVNELAAEFPDNTQLLLTQALILAEFEQFDPALDKVQKLLRIQPDQTQAIMLEARILLANNASRPFARLQDTLQADPENKGLRLQYARLLTANDMEAARQQFEILSNQSPRDGDLLLSLALINREVGDDLAAKAYLRQMLALGQRLNEAHFYLGRIAEDEGEAETAVYEYMQVEESREFLSAANRIGTILVSSGKEQESQAWFKQQREANPQRREQLYGVEADILSRSGDADQAMRVLNQSLAEFPASFSLRYARSMLAEQQNDLALMESDLRAIIADDPENTTALNALGYTLANRTERYAEAYDLISTALSLQPEEPAILDSMGWVLYRTGRYQESLDYLTRAYAVFPDPEVAAHLGEVLWVSGETEAATTIWQDALAKDPDHKVLLATLKRFGISPPASETARQDGAVETGP